MRALIELHLHHNTELPRKYGKRIRALGGSYSAVRGYETMLKLRCTKAALCLADELIDAYPRSRGGKKKAATVIFRPAHLQLKPVVYYVSSICPPLYAYAAAAARGWAKTMRVIREARRAERIERAHHRQVRDSAIVERASLEAGERLASAWLLEHCA